MGSEPADGSLGVQAPVRETTAEWAGSTLGPYQLVGALGAGGMSTVWEGVHAATWSPVAIKLLSSKYAKASAFRNEIRLSASLDHPSIVRVLDFGNTTEDVLYDGDLLLKKGGLYLALELVRGGSLKPLCARLGWRDVRSILLRLLDALAHAHARGIVHRDIKPANVLINRERTEVKLTDFGIAQAVRGGVVGELEKAFAGTPAYMAPEQCRREARDYGPWTDFYALGCLGYALVTGHPPFPEARTVVEVLEAHTSRAPPPLAPASAVPAGFEAWLRTLLAKNPADRYQRASEAARDLDDMPATYADAPDPTAWVGVDDPDEVETEPDRPTPEALNLDRDDRRYSTLRFDRPYSIDTPIIHTVGESPTLDVSPLPQSWGTTEEREGGPSPVSANLGLYWLRRPRMSGRVQERDELWTALHEAHRDSEARAVILRGSSGTGKSRLARWLAERAHEIASAEMLDVSHAAEGGPGQGLVHAIQRRLKLAGLEPAAARGRVERFMTSWGVSAPTEMRSIADLLLPNERSGVLPRTAAAARRERRMQLQRLIRYLAAGRTLVLWLDDVHWGVESLEVVRRLLSPRGRISIPVLAVMTVQTETLPSRPAEAALLEELTRRSAVRDLQVPALDDQDHRRLVESLLPLEEKLAARVADRTAGNPQFAIQLIGNWVERGLLEPGPDGLRLRLDAEVDFPDDLHAVWSGRIAQFLEGRPDHDGAALEMTALHGRRIDPGEWAAACSHAGLAPSADLVDALLDAHLATCEPGGPEEGWALAHAMLRESLERRAVEADRHRDHHFVLARSLRSRSGLRAAERVAGHLIAAGRPAEAATPLLDAVRARLAAGDLAHTAVLLERFDALAEEAEAQLAPTTFGWGRLLHARLAGLTGDDERFDFWAAEVEAITATVGLEGRKLRIALTFEKARRCLRRAELDAAWQRLEVVEQYAVEVRDDETHAACLDAMASVARSRGDLDVAQSLLQRSVVAHEAAGDPAGAGRALATLAEMAARSGLFGAADDLTRLASGYFERARDRAGEASLEVLRALSARLQGDLPAATSLFRGALEKWEDIGAPQARTTQLALAQVLVLREEFDEAEPLLEDCLSWFANRDEPGGVAVSRLTLLPLLAHQNRWEEWDTHFAMGKDQLDATGYVDEDAAACATEAGNVAAALGHPTRAWAVWQLAKRLVERAGRRFEA